MLILTRRPGEGVTITTPRGETIVVELFAVKGNQVRMGFIAEKKITVHRSEIQQKINKECK